MTMRLALMTPGSSRVAQRHAQSQSVFHVTTTVKLPAVPVVGGVAGYNKKAVRYGTIGLRPPRDATFAHTPIVFRTKF